MTTSSRTITLTEPAAGPVELSTAMLLETMDREARARADAAGFPYHEDALKEALATVILDGGVNMNALLAMTAAGNVQAAVDELLSSPSVANGEPISSDLLSMAPGDKECDDADTDPAIPGLTADMRAIMAAVLALGTGTDNDTHVTALMRFAPVGKEPAFETWLRGGARHDNVSFVRVLNVAMIDPNLTDESRTALERGAFGDSDDDGPVVRAPPRRLAPVPFVPVPLTELPERVPGQPPLSARVPDAGMFLDFETLPNSTERNKLFALYNKYVGDATNVLMTKHRATITGAPKSVNHGSLRRDSSNHCTIYMMMAVLSGLTVEEVEARAGGRMGEREKETKRAKRFKAGRAARLTRLESAAIGAPGAARM